MNEFDFYVIDCIRNNKKIGGRKRAIEKSSKTLTELYSIATNVEIPNCDCGNKLQLRSVKEGYRKYCSTTCYNKAMSVRNATKESVEYLKEKTKNKMNDQFIEKSILYEEAITFYKNNNYNVSYVSKKFNLLYTDFKSVLQYFCFFDKTKNEGRPYYMNEVNKKISDNINTYLKDELTAKEIAEICGCSPNYVITFLKSKNIKLPYKNVSSHERIIRKFLDTLDVKYLVNYRKLFGKELDIYIPDYNLAIEINGLYWHNETDHSIKYNLCKDKNIKLLQFSDKEIENSIQVVKSIIKYNLNKLDHKIDARKCEIKKLDEEAYKNFLLINSLYEYKDSANKYGLFFKNELVYVCGTTNGIIDNIVPKNNYIVRGGFMKLINKTKARNIVIDSLIFQNKNFKEYNLIEGSVNYKNLYTYNSSGLFDIKI